MIEAIEKFKYNHKDGTKLFHIDFEKRFPINLRQEIVKYYEMMILKDAPFNNALFCSKCGCYNKFAPINQCSECLIYGVPRKRKFSSNNDIEE